MGTNLSPITFAGMALLLTLLLAPALPAYRSIIRKIVCRALSSKEEESYESSRSKRYQMVVYYNALYFPHVFVALILLAGMLLTLIYRV